MAMFHLTTDHVKRSTGRTAVAAAAYRAGAKLKNHQDGITHDYQNRKGVLHTEIVLPRDCKADWALDREKLWNAAEKAEKRKDSRTAREIEFALPAELNFEQQIELTRELCTHLANLYSTAVDIALHAPSKDGDQRNYHVHALLPTRTVEPDGLGNKIMFDRSDKWLREHGLPTAKEQLLDVREVGEQTMNHHLAKAGLDIRVSCRSHEDRGLKIEPTKHVGVHATNMERKGKKIHRKRLIDSDKKFNMSLIYHDPKDIFKIITDEKAVFDKRDIARTIHRYTNLEGQDFQTLFGKVLSSSELIQLRPEIVDVATGNRTPAKYSTRQMMEIESKLVNHAEKLRELGHEILPSHIDRAIARQNKKLKSKFGAGMSHEQIEGIKHLTGSGRLSILVGKAGTGKSTLLAVAHQAWKSQGFRVIGASLSAKAADGLEQSSGIRSETLAALERRLEKGGQLHKDDVLVVDEAGMVDTMQMSRIVAKIKKSGAKLVLVGDPDQLQSIGAGGSFRALGETVGAYSLTEIRRQKLDWQAKATKDFATGNTRKALRSYDLRRSIKFANSKYDSIRTITTDYAADYRKSPESTRLVLAHRKLDVKMLNSSIRAKLIADGHLRNSKEYVCGTINGQLSFAVGDRVSLLANSRELGLKNGMLGSIEKINKKIMVLKLDGNGRKVKVPLNKYKSFVHGYAATVHKSQGTTVDYAYVYASKTMDRHLAYVAMTRHRWDAKMYASRSEFNDVSDLADSLSRGSGKESTLDYAQSFAGRRLNADSDLKSPTKTGSGKWGNRKQENTSSLDIALDLLGHAMEERMWLRFHGVKGGELPRVKLDHALIMLDKVRTGLSEAMKSSLADNRDQFNKMFISSGGSERVAMLKNILNQEIRNRSRLRNAEMDMHPKLEPPAPSPKF